MRWPGLSLLLLLPPRALQLEVQPAAAEENTQAPAGHRPECGCATLEVTSEDGRARRVQAAALGRYLLVEGVRGAGWPVWRHQASGLLLHRSDKSSSWVVSQSLGSDSIRLENRGSGCPHTLRAAWRVAGPRAEGLLEDFTLRARCPSWPCGREVCGHNAHCDVQAGHCVCDDDTDGSPLDRCFPRIASLCNCREIQLASSNPAALTNQQGSFGTYFLQGASSGYPVYQHRAGLLFLYQQDGSWLVSDSVGSRAGGIQNQGDPSMCPYRFKTAWEYADISLPGWQWSYDYTASMVCASDPCSVTKCGQRATCTPQGPEASCSCDIGYDGNPYVQCFPVEVPADCPCTEVVVASSGRSAVTQSDKMGRYFLFGYYAGEPVYQHRSGQEYLFRAHGQAWAIGATPGGLRVGVIAFSNSSCPYRVEGGVWQHSTRGQLDQDPGLRVDCRRNAQVQNPIERPTTITTTPTTTTTTTVPVEELLVSGWPSESVLESGLAAERRVTQALQALDRLDYGPVLAVEQLEERPTPRPVDLVRGNHLDAEDQQAGESIQLHFFSTPSSPAPNQLPAGEQPKARPTPGHRVPLLPTVVPRRRTTFSTLLRLPPTLPTRSPALLASTLKTTTQNLNDILTALKTTTRKKSRPASPQSLHPAYTSTAISTSTQKLERGQLEQRVVQQQLASLHPAEVASEVCNCSSIIITSNHPVTVAKHSGELGRYRLAGELGGRPVYRHARGGFYLYYQEESGGNWLVNTAPGLLYGGLQNSKDFPICPYLLSTVWQYGDSEVGGWMYDSSLRVTCPSHPCSVVKCGFRASCSVQAGRAQCQCRHGFQGDPYTRCYPRLRAPCSCRALAVESPGPSRQHQRDKMGAFHLWGFYNEHPVYQHYSGLDFLYFHKNQVWGIGPKVGGKRAGLLNFSTAQCPYEMTSPWQFGTKEASGSGRQLDTHLAVRCTDPA